MTSAVSEAAKNGALPARIPWPGKISFGFVEDVARAMGRALVEAIREAGLPPGVVNMVTGTGADVGAPLVESSIVRLITLTGSIGAGQAIAAEDLALAARLARAGRARHLRVVLTGESDDPGVLEADPPGTIQLLGGTDVGHKGYGLALLVEAMTGGLAAYLCSENAAPHDWLTLTGGAIGQGLPVALDTPVRAIDWSGRGVTCETADDCSDDELCTLGGSCVPRLAEIRYCMKNCGDDGDCRHRHGDVATVEHPAVGLGTEPQQGRGGQRGSGRRIPGRASCT